MNRELKFLPLAVLITTAWAAQAQQVAYSPSMLRALVPEGQEIDTTFFEKGFDIAPGSYQFTLKLNGEHWRKGKYEVRENGDSLDLAMQVKDIYDLPLKKEVLEEHFSNLAPETVIFPLSSKLEGATASIDTKEMVINISIPQIFLIEDDGWVDVAPQEEWDYGETGAVINYNLSGLHQVSRFDHSDSTNFYANLAGRLNFGAWRLHTSGSVSAYRQNAESYRESGHDWDMWNTYLQRDIPAIKGSLELGEISTSSEIFDSVPLRGMRMATNIQMLPNKDRSYSPIIEGIANTNAQVVIRQNGHIVYTVNVAAGPFRLENLPSFGNYGDLEVVIKESDGTERILNIPYSSVPNMLREGQYRYDINVGRYYRKNSSSKIDDPMMFMGTMSYGLPGDITIFGGSLISEGYYALAMGTGMSLGRYGALAADVVHSKNQADDSRGLKEGSGSAWRVRYEKTLNDLGTRVNLANYQYRTGKYMTMQEFIDYGSESSSFWFSHGRIKSRWQLAMSQNLGSYGSLSLGADYAQYHATSADMKSFNVGYGTSIKGMGISLNYARNYIKVNNGSNWDSNHTLMFNLNIPLSLFTRYKASSAIDSTTLGYQGRMHKEHSGETNYTHSVVMNGYSDDNKWSWSVSQELGNHEDRSTSASVTYDGDRFIANAGFDHSYAMNGYQLGLNGALVLHRTGLTATSTAYDSIAVIDVPDAAGVKVQQYFDTYTDSFGHGILTYLTNYTKNEIAIDPATLPDGAILLDSSNRTVVPTSGAIVRVTYPVRFGKQVVLVLQDRLGQALPFGSTVKLITEDGSEDPYVGGIVGEGGRVYLSGLPSKGLLQVSGKKVHTFKYELQKLDSESSGDFQEIPTIVLKSNENV